MKQKPNMAVTLTDSKNASVASPRDRNSLVEWLERQYRWLFLVIVLFTIFTRFYNLEHKAFHHDESLYSKYSFDYGKGLGHKYHPLMHGPFFFMLNGTFQRYWDKVYVDLLKRFNKVDPVLPQSGYNDYSARTIPAILGVAVVLLCLLLRDNFGKIGALLAAGYFAFSPSFTYYTRFMREDVYVLFTNHLFTVGALLFFARKQWRWMYLASVGLALFWCTKENHFAHTLAYIAFLIMIELYKILVPTWKQHSRSEWLKAAGRAFTAWMVRIGRFTYQNLFHILLCLGIFFTIFYLLYTDFFRHPKGFLDGLYRLWIDYWSHQNKIQRVRGDYHYHLWRMAMYELPLILAYIGGMWTVFRRLKTHVRAATVVALILLVSFIFAYHIPLPAYKELGAYGNLHDRPDLQEKLSFWAIGLELLHMQVWGHVFIFLFVVITGFWCVFILFWYRNYVPAFFIFTSMFNFCTYSYLGEKVSWLTIHIQYPMVFVLAYYGRQWLLKSRRLIPVIFGVFALFQIYANYGLNIYKNGINEDNPAEIIVYTQTHKDIIELNQIIYQAARLSGLGYDVPLSIQGSAAWPYSWYLRDFRRWFTPEGGFPSADALVVVNDWEKQADMSYIFKDHYKKERRKLRAWDVLPNMDEQHKSNKPNWTDMIRYYLFRLDRTPMIPTGSTDVVVFIRNDIAEGRYDPNFGKDETTRLSIQQKARSIRPVFVRPQLTFGSQGAAPNQFNEPRGLAVDSTGNLYVTDTLNHRIVKYSPAGEVLKTWGGSGDGPGQFNQPIGIAVGKYDQIYVADTWNHRIQVFDTEGTFVKMWGKGGADNAGDSFWAPKGLAVDSVGDLYVTNTGLHRVNKFKADGQFVKLFGVQTEKESTRLIGFHEPVGIAVGPNDNIYVADTANHRVVLLNSQLVALDQFAVPGWDNFYTEPFISVLDTGEVFITDAHNNRIQRFDTQKNMVQNWGTNGAGPGQFNLPKGLTIKDGAIYVVDCMNHRVQKFNQSDLPAPQSPGGE